MDRVAFLEAARAATPLLRAVRLPGFDSPVYVRRMTLREAREINDASEGDDDKPDADPALANAKSAARILRDENGELLFDAQDDAQVRELAAVLDGMDVLVISRLTEATMAVNAAVANVEVDAEGN